MLHLLLCARKANNLLTLKSLFQCPGYEDVDEEEVVGATEAPSDSRGPIVQGKTF